MINGRVEEILLEKADENLQAAKMLSEDRCYNTALNCLYHSVYLKIYRRLIHIGKDTVGNKFGKHAAALEYLRDESSKRDPDAGRVLGLFSRLKSGRVKANYFGVHIEEREYKRAYESYVINKVPLERFLANMPEQVERDDHGCEV